MTDLELEIMRCRKEIAELKRDLQNEKAEVLRLRRWIGRIEQAVGHKIEEAIS